MSLACPPSPAPPVALIAPPSPYTQACFLQPTSNPTLLAAFSPSDSGILLLPSKEHVVSRPPHQVLRLRAFDGICLALWDDGVLSYGSQTSYQLDSSSLDFALCFSSNRVVVFVAGAAPTLSRCVLPEPTHAPSLVSALLSFLTAPPLAQSDLPASVAFHDPSRVAQRVEACTRLVAAQDNFGRLLLFHQESLTVLWILRGYRGASFGFFLGHLLCVQRRGTVEMWDKARQVCAVPAGEGWRLVCDETGSHAGLASAAAGGAVTLLEQPSAWRELDLTRQVRAFCAGMQAAEPGVVELAPRGLSNAGLLELLQQLAELDVRALRPLSASFHRSLLEWAAQQVKDEARDGAALRAELSVRGAALDALQVLGQLKQPQSEVPREAGPESGRVARALEAPRPPKPMLNVSAWLCAWRSKKEGLEQVGDFLWAPLLLGDVFTCKHVCRIEEQALGGLQDRAFVAWFLSRRVEWHMAEPLKSTALGQRLLRGDRAGIEQAACMLACGPLGLARAWLVADCLELGELAARLRVATGLAVQLDAHDFSLEALDRVDALCERVAALGLHLGLDAVAGVESSGEWWAVEEPPASRVAKAVTMAPGVLPGLATRLAVGWAERRGWHQAARVVRAAGADPGAVWGLACKAASAGEPGSLLCVAECLAKGPDERRAVLARLLERKTGLPLVGFCVHEDWRVVDPSEVSGLLELLRGMEMEPALEAGRALGLKGDEVVAFLVVDAYATGRDDVALDLLSANERECGEGLGEALLGVARARVGNILRRAKVDGDKAPLLALVQPRVMDWILAADSEVVDVSLEATHALLLKAQGLEGNSSAVSGKLGELRVVVETIWGESR